MPQHGHGLPTKPRVTRPLGNGDHLVEGDEVQHGRLVGREVPRSRGRGGRRLRHVQPEALTTTSVMRRSRTVLTSASASALSWRPSLMRRSPARPARWTPRSATTLRSLSLASLEPLPARSVEPLRRRPARGGARRAAVLRHAAERQRQGVVRDLPRAAAGVPGRHAARRTASGTTARRTMPIAGTAHGPWLFWDGRADSQWSQALGPLESAVEHGGKPHAVRARRRRALSRRVRGGVRRAARPERAARRSRPRVRHDVARGVAAHPSGAAGRDHARVREHRQGDRRVRAAHRARAVARSTDTWTPSSRDARTRRRAPSRATRRPGCGCSSARRAA